MWLGKIGGDGGVRPKLHEGNNRSDSGEGEGRADIVAGTVVAAGMRVDGLANATRRLAGGQLPEGISDLAKAEGARITGARADLPKKGDHRRAEARGGERNGRS